MNTLFAFKQLKPSRKLNKKTNSNEKDEEETSTLSTFFLTFFSAP